MTTTKQEVGLIGLAVMGENLALNIEEHGLHSDRRSAYVIDGINVADVETVRGPHSQAAESGFENCGMGLFLSDNTRIRDALETIGNSTTVQHVCNFAVGI